MCASIFGLIHLEKTHIRSEWVKRYNNSKAAVARNRYFTNTAIKIRILKKPFVHARATAYHRAYVQLTVQWGRLLGVLTRTFVGRTTIEKEKKKKAFYFIAHKRTDRYRGCRLIWRRHCGLEGVPLGSPPLECLSASFNQVPRKARSLIGTWRSPS